MAPCGCARLIPAAFTGDGLSARRHLLTRPCRSRSGGRFSSPSRSGCRAPVTCALLLVLVPIPLASSAPKACGRVSMAAAAPSHGVAVTVTGVAAASGPARCRPLSESSSAPRRRACIQSRCAPHSSLQGGASESGCDQYARMRAYACARPATLPRSLSPRSLPRRPAGRAGTGPRVVNARLLFNMRTYICPRPLPARIKSGHAVRVYIKINR